MYVKKLSVKYGIRLRTKGQARYLALKAGKLPQQYREVNHDFFSKWTTNMAYVLGYFCADGNMHRLKKSNSWLFSIGSNDVTHLQLIKETIGSTHPFQKKSSQPKLLNLRFASDKICKDLLKLGITPRKSVTLHFPKVPQRYLNDFIRGYFDGDGSIYIEERNQTAKLSISSGSKNFLVAIRNHLRYLIPGVQGNVYKHKEARCYYLRYYRIDDMPRLFKFLYATGQATLCLKRKYEKFKEVVAASKRKTRIRDARRKRSLRHKLRHPVVSTRP